MALDVIDQREKEVRDTAEDQAGNMYKAWASAVGDTPASQLSPEQRIEAAGKMIQSSLDTLVEFLGVSPKWAGDSVLKEYVSTFYGDPRQYLQGLSSPLAMGETVAGLADKFAKEFGAKVAYDMGDKLPELQEEVGARYSEVTGQPLRQLQNPAEVVDVYRALKQIEARKEALGLHYAVPK